MEVPFRTFALVSLVDHAEVMSLPGANRSRHPPK
jgi:hypothetical protein